MKEILNNPQHALKLLSFYNDAILVIDAHGICREAQFNTHPPSFIHAEEVLGYNFYKLNSIASLANLMSDHEAVLQSQCPSSKDYAFTVANTTYFFECSMHPYEGMVIWFCNNITDRVRQSRQLEHKSRQLFEVQTAAAIGIWRYNSRQHSFSFQGKIDVIHPQLPYSISLSDFKNLILIEDVENFQNHLNNYVEGDFSEGSDFRIRMDGEIIYLHTRAFSREVLSDGNIILEGYAQNITEIQRNRNDISLLTHAINNSSEDIFAAKRNGQLVFANRKFRAHHNIPESTDLSKLYFYNLSSSSRNPEVWESLVKSVSREKEENRFVVHNPVEGHPEILAYEGNAYWVTSDQGEEVLWAFGRDISQRIRQGQQLKRLSSVLNKVVESLPAGIVVKDPQNDFRYLYRNRESQRRERIHIEQLQNSAANSCNREKSPRGSNRTDEIKIPAYSRNAIGLNDFDCFPPEMAQEKRNQDIRIIETGQEMHWTAEEVAPEGGILYLDKRKMRIAGDDFPPLLLSIEWNITETEQMRRELEVAKEKAETSDRLKSAFLANMSHEIRTPLNAIVGFSRLIAESHDEEERRYFCNIVESNNERLLGLINEILDLSKIEANMVEFDFTPVRLNLLLDEVYESHRLRVPGGVELVNDAPADFDVIISTDKNRLFQVLSNLIGNAFKFTTEGSVTYGYRVEDARIYFYVRDTGRGIAPEKIGRVFERFVKADNFVQGTGLGLSISKTIVERLGGEIGVRSEVDKGTEFYFFLPLPEDAIQQEEDFDTLIQSLQANASADTVADMKAHGEVPAATEEKADDTAATEGTSADEKTTEQRGVAPAEKTAAAGAAKAKKHRTDKSDKKPLILVAEDIDSNYILIQAILKRHYRIERAKDGIEAVNLYEALHPDLIFMDMKMPNLDGLDATRIIRQLGNVPIVALTAYAYDSDRKAAKEAGCNDFMTKPYTPEQLLRMVEKYI